MKTENAKFFIHEKNSKKKETDTLKADAISIYGLSPGGESKFSNIKMCEKVCKGGKLKTAKIVVTVIYLYLDDAKLLVW